MDLHSVGHTFHGMTDPLGIQILQTLKTIALQYCKEVDINLIEEIRIEFYIPQQKLDILQDIYFTTPEQFVFLYVAQCILSC